MSYVPRPLSEMSRSEPGKIDCDARSLRLGSAAYARDHYLVGELQTGLTIECSNSWESLGDRICGPSQAQVLILAGGLGDAHAGNSASRVAVESITRYLLEHPLGSEHGPQAAMAAAFAASQQELRQRRASPRESNSSATSVTMALVQWPDVQIAHVGDIRCLLYRRGKLQALTSIHTLGAKCSQANDSDWPAPSWRDVLWNAITGTERNAEPEFAQTQLTLGDALIMMTAPLAKAVSEMRLVNLLREDLAATDTCGRLLEAAQAGGCREEGAVLVVRFRSPQRWEQLQASQQATNDRGQRAGNGSSAKSSPGPSSPRFS